MRLFRTELSVELYMGSRVRDVPPYEVCACCCSYYSIRWSIRPAWGRYIETLGQLGPLEQHDMA